jgi:hypothetical protein
MPQAPAGRDRPVGGSCPTPGGEFRAGSLPTLEQVFYAGGVGRDRPPGSGCPRCLELEDEVAALRERLRKAGLFIDVSPGPNPVPDGEAELRRWLAAYPRATAAEGFRAGWVRMARWIRPRLVEADAAWWRQVRENERLRARLGVLLAELERARDCG